IMPGKARESRIIEVLRSRDQDRMPPRDVADAMPAEQIEMIARWINEGAKLDAGLDTKADLARELRLRWTPPRPLESYKLPVIVGALTFSPDSKRLVVTGHHELTLWNVAD